MHHIELERLLNQELNVAAFQDYSPNGLQVEGKKEIQKIVTGVTACQALLEAAVTLGADAILVHHGYFWKSDSPVVRGMLRQRLKILLENNINLYGYHLPLDAHPTLGNNAQLGQRLGLTQVQEMDTLSLQGEWQVALQPDEMRQRLENVLGRSVLHCGDTGPRQIRRVGWCTGGGQSYIDLAADLNMDAFVTGEVSEKTIHIARERELHFFAAGHHATERYGIQALGEWLADTQGLEVTFIDIPNPA